MRSSSFDGSSELLNDCGRFLSQGGSCPSEMIP
jgi:hypothetical protein